MLSGFAALEDLHHLQTMILAFLEEIVLQQMETQAFIRSYHLDLSNPLDALRLAKQLTSEEFPPSTGRFGEIIWAANDGATPHRVSAVFDEQFSNLLLSCELVVKTEEAIHSSHSLPLNCPRKQHSFLRSNQSWRYSSLFLSLFPNDFLA